MTVVKEEIFGAVIVEHHNLRDIEKRLLEKLNIVTSPYDADDLVQWGERATDDVDYTFPKPVASHRYPVTLKPLNGYEFVSIFVPYNWGSSHYDLFIGVPISKYNANQTRLVKIIDEIVQVANDLGVKIRKPLVHTVEYNLNDVYSGYGDEGYFN